MATSASPKVQMTWDEVTMQHGMPQEIYNPIIPSMRSAFPITPTEEVSLRPGPIYGVKAHFIANKDKIQADDFNSEDHVHSVLVQKRHSACGLVASRLHNQCRCLLQHT